MSSDEWTKVLAVAGPAGIVGLLVAVARGVIEQLGGWRVWFVGMTAAVTVSILVGLGLQATEIGLLAQSAIMGTCAYVSRDILMGLQQLSAMLATNPFGFIAKIRGAIRGDKE